MVNMGYVFSNPLMPPPVISEIYWDEDGTGESDTQKFTLSIAFPLVTLTIDMVPLIDPVIGTNSQDFSELGVTFEASGGVPPYSWTLSVDPPELALTPIGSGSNGKNMGINGALQHAGDFSVTVTLKDDLKEIASRISIFF